MYGASIENRGDSKYHAVTKGGRFVMGTDGTAPNPVDTFLASHCACVGHYVRDYLVEQGIVFSSFAVEAEGAATADASRLEKITIWIDLKDVSLDDRLHAGLLGAIERCKLHGTLKAATAITVVMGRRQQAA